MWNTAHCCAKKGTFLNSIIVYRFNRTLYRIDWDHCCELNCILLKFNCRGFADLILPLEKVCLSISGFSAEVWFILIHALLTNHWPGNSARLLTALSWMKTTGVVKIFSTWSFFKKLMVSCLIFLILHVVQWTISIFLIAFVVLIIYWRLAP